MPGIVLRAVRYGKNSRSTPRLRRLLGAVHGALRLAVLTKTLNFSLRRFVDSKGDQPGLIIMSCHLDATISDRSAVRLPIAASGGFLVHLDWPAFTPAPIEIRLLVPAR
jgi:hypothetical protein